MTTADASNAALPIWSARAVGEDVGVALARHRVVHHDERLAADLVGELGGRHRDVGVRGGGRALADHRLLRLRVPAADLHLADLGDGAHPGAELHQVHAPHEGRAAGVGRLARLRPVGGDRGLLEQERVAVDAAVEARPDRQRVQEVEVGLVDLEHVVVRALGLVHVRLEAGVGRELLRDVGQLHVLVGLGDPAGGEAVRLVVAAHDRARPERVVVRLDRGDLALDEDRLALVGLRRGRDLDRLADLEARLAQEVPLRVPEHDRERVGHRQAIDDERALDRGHRGRVEVAAVDLDGGGARDGGGQRHGGQGTLAASALVGMISVMPEWTAIGSSTSLSSAIARQ